MTTNELAGKRVAVAGATGFIGSHLVERLVRDGADVLGIARSRRRINNLASVEGKYRFEAADITDCEHMSDLFADFRPEIVFHLACHPDGKENFRQVRDSIVVNTLGVATVLEAAREAGSSAFILADSVKVFGNGGAPARLDSVVDPECSYAIAKASAWQLCRLYSHMCGIRVLGIRPTFVYGPRQNWNLISYVEKCIDANEPVRLQGGSQTRDLLYVTDAVEAFIRAALSGASGVSIPVGSGKEMTIREICEAALLAAGSNLPVDVAAEPPRLTEIWRSYCDNEDVDRIFGWRPSITLAEGLADLFRDKYFTQAAVA